MNDSVKKLVIPFLFLLLLFACRKEEFTTNSDAVLKAGADTLHFDTVFTSTGSVTQLFKIFNRNNKSIRISSVRLGGGVASPFKINVDGTPGPQVMNIDIGAKDSIYVFVSVSINPNNTALPFVVQDSVEISYNGNREKVQLEAYGQNAHFYRNHTVTGTRVWTNDLPHVILGRLTVDTTAKLIITRGSRIYMHADAPFIINGTLQVQGEKEDSNRVVFSGDRLDVPYRSFPAGYPGLIFTERSKDNIIQYGIIKNAYQGIVAVDPSVNSEPKLLLSETIIDNAYDAGLLGVNTSITATNVLISNCGKNLLLVKGGNYRFTHCTLASFSNSYLPHKEPVALISNVLSQNAPSFPLTALFTNCIFWGESGLIKDEVAVVKKGTSSFSLTFSHVLWRMQNTPPNTITNGTVINNEPPLFDSINTFKHVYNFRLRDDSPAKNKGTGTTIRTDLDGKPRPIGLPDLGAYETQ